MSNNGYDLPDWVGMTWYRCYYTPDRDSYLLYWGWSIESYTKFSYVPVSHDDFPPTLSSLSFLSSILPSPKNTKLSHRTLSLHAMIKNEHRVQHTPSTACTEYSIHRVQHSLSTAYTAYSIHRVMHSPRTAYTPYCIIPRSTVSCSQPVSSLGRPFVLNSQHSCNYELTNE
jgi:hypothetical protein